MRDRSVVLLFVLVLAQPVCAQIRDLATTDEGSVVYFSTTLRLAGNHGPLTPKILSWNSSQGGRLTVLAERDRSGQDGITNPSALKLPDVSGDGAVAAYTGERSCLGAFCGTSWGVGEIERFHGDVVSAAGASMRGRDGLASVSRNGRYAVFHARGAVIETSTYGGLVTRVDLVNGAETSTATDLNPSAPAVRESPVRRTVVSSGGLVVSGGQGSLYFFDGQQTRNIPVTRRPRQIAIDDVARIIAYDTGRDENSEIVIFDPATQVETVLVSAAEGAWQPSLSADSELLLFLSRANFAARNDGRRVQAFVIGTNGTSLRQVTRPEDDVTAAVLAGNGRVAYAATVLNQLLRIDLADGTIQEVIPATPSLSHQAHDTAPGSLVWLRGTGLSQTASVAGSFPLPTVLDGIRLLIAGTPAPLVSATPDEIVAQVPWDTPPGRTTLTVDVPSESPLEGATAELLVLEERLRFLYAEPSQFDPATGQPFAGAILAAHDDFRSLVTATSPARPGEVVHVYMTGLGAVEPAVPTGEAVPTGFAVWATLSMRCTAQGPGDVFVADVVFAGLAPGFAGLYQVDLRLPEKLLPNPVVQLQCWTPRSGAFGTIALR